MILVTGANGFLGSAVVHRLAATGDEPIRCLVRPGSSTARIDDLIAAERIDVVRGTLNDPDDCAAAIAGAEVIYHLAAGMGGGAMADVWLSTVVATDNLLRALGGSDSLRRFVHTSSFSVYGVGSLPPGAPVDEQTPLESRRAEADNYSHAKLRQEELVREAAAEHGFELVVVRPGMVYGPGGGGLSRRIGIRQGRLMVALGGRNLLPLTYVDNCAEAMVLLGRHADSGGETVNIVDDDLVTAAAFLARYRREAESLTTVPLPKPVTRALAEGVVRFHHRTRGLLPAAITPHMYRTIWAGNTYDNGRLRSFGWTQTVSTDDGLDRYFRSVARREPAG